LSRVPQAKTGSLQKRTDYARKKPAQALTRPRPHRSTDYPDFRQPTAEHRGHLLKRLRIDGTPKLIAFANQNGFARFEQTSWRAL